MGWREMVTLPELGIGPLSAKADTGALSAALHAENVTIVSRSGARYVAFDAYVDEDRAHARRCELPVHGVKRVRSSSGKVEERWTVETDVELAGERWKVLLTLTDRADMVAPLLLGRATLRGRYLVHPGKSYLLTTDTGRAASAGERT
ncbi:MAG: RimK/LysX family protein [Hyphomicrobiales bacterium]